MEKSLYRKIATGGLIAVLYIALTYLSDLMGLASGAIQIRLGESLAVLPCLFPAAVPGLTIGCVLANLLTGCNVWDVIFGSTATLLGALGTWLLRKEPKFAWIPPVVSNMLIIPIILIRAYQIQSFSFNVPFTQTTLSGSGFFPMMAAIAIGEIISCGILGMAVYYAARKISKS